MSKVIRIWGFTILELIIVVVIVSLLAFVGVPEFFKYFKRQNASVTQAKLEEAFRNTDPSKMSIGMPDGKAPDPDIKDITAPVVTTQPIDPDQYNCDQWETLYKTRRDLYRFQLESGRYRRVAETEVLAGFLDPRTEYDDYGVDLCMQLECDRDEECPDGLLCEFDVGCRPPDCENRECGKDFLDELCGTCDEDTEFCCGGTCICNRESKEVPSLTGHYIFW